MKTTKLISFALILSCVFFSCKNFMDGESVLQELQKQIDYANSPSYSVHINSEPGTGSYKKGGGDNTFKIGDEIQIEYALQAGFQFIGWSVTSETGEELKDNVSFTPKNSLNTTVKFLKEGNINITPKCTFNPAISEYEPKYNWLGVSCDTPIVITFNIVIDETTLTKENILITNKNDTGINYWDYFDLQIEVDKEKNVTVLTLKPDNSIQDLFKDKNEQIDISISLLKNNIFVKDSTDVTLMGECSWYYRINSGVESTLPVIEEVCFYKAAPDADGKFDEASKLTSTNFSKWEKDDFITNHVKDLYLYIKGYDADSGLDYVKIKGDLIKSANGENAEIDAFENRLGKKEDFKFTEKPDENGNYFYEYYTKIDFTQQFIDNVSKNNLILNDGLVQYDIYLVDRAGNNSEAETLYVIKDTTVTINRIRSNSVACYEENGNTIYLDNISEWERVAVNGIDTVNLFFTSIANSNNLMLDPFFKFENEELVDPIKIIDLKWGYDLNLSEPIKPNVNPCSEVGEYPDGVYYTIKRDENRETYIKITAQDNVGNTNSRIIAIPEKSRIQKIEKNEKDNSYRVYYRNFNENCPIENTESTISIKNGTKEPKWGAPYSITPDNRSQLPYFDDISYNKSLKDVYDKDIGLLYYICAMNTYEFDGWEIRGTSSGNINIKADPESIDDKYIPKKVATVKNGAINKNEGFITLTTTFSDYENNSNYEYFVGYKATDMDDYSYSASKEFSVQSGHKYELKPFVYKNGHYTANSQSEIVTLDFTSPDFDNKSPEFTFEPLLSNEYNSSLPNYVELYPFKDNSGLLQSNGIYEIEYWFIPNPTENSSAIACTEEYLYSYKTPNILKIKTSEYPELVYDNNNTVDELKSGRIYIPLDDLPEFSYTLFVKVTDNSSLKNYKIFSNYANNVLIKDDDFSFAYDKNKDYYSITFNNGLKQEHQFSIFPKFQFYNTNTKKWENYLITESIDYRNINRIYISDSCYYFAANEKIDSSYSDGGYSTDFYNDCSNQFVRISAYQGFYNVNRQNGYYKTKYVYPEYYKLKASNNPMVYKNKGILTLDNGVQIFTDNPVLVHTFYCSSNLGNDDDMWLNHGIETGIIIENSSFTYQSENLRDIPSGKFYKTIVHFADGSIFSTDVKVMR